MIRRVMVCLAAATVVAASSGAAARLLRKAAPARQAAARKPQAMLAEGVCRYSISMAGTPLDEVRYLFQSEDLTLPRQGGVTPVVSERDYRQDLPPGAPEIERLVYAHDVVFFDVTPEKAPGGEKSSTVWTQARLSPGLPPGPEVRVLGLPWISLPPPRAGLTWQRTETLAFPHIQASFQYRVTGLTTVGGRRAWHVERSLAGHPKTLAFVDELKQAAEVQQWQESFWVDAGSRELLRMERRLQLATHGEVPLTLKLAVDWARKGTRPLLAAEYASRVHFLHQLAQVERQVMDARGRTTLDGESDLRQLQDQLQGLREDHPDRRYQLTYDKINMAIQQGIQSFQQREHAG